MTTNPVGRPPGTQPKETSPVGPQRRFVAPWVRTRLRTAPGAALAFGLLVLLTSFLAAAFPRAVDAYENRGLRHDVTAAAPSRSGLELTTPPPPIELPEAAREASLLPTRLGPLHRRVLGLLPDPLRADPGQSAYGVRTTKTLVASDRWLPRPDTKDPEFTLAAHSGVAEHATVREGRLPRVTGKVTAATREVEAAVTVQTAKTLNIRTGSVVHLGDPAGTVLSARVTGIVEPREPGGGYWSHDSLLRTPGLDSTPTTLPQVYWKGALLIAPEAAPALLGTTGDPQPYWRIAPATAHLTAADVPRLTSRVASLEDGPDLLRLKEAVDNNAELTTDLDGILASYGSMRSAIAPVVAVAAIGVGAVATVVVLMTGGLFAARRRSEIALLRSRGGSLRGIGGRLLAETAVVTVPAAAAGLLAAVLAVDDARLPYAALGSGAVALVACAALPVRAMAQHRVARAHGGRDDLVLARPSGRRKVAEVTLLVLAVGAVVALRRRGTSDAGDHLVSAAPVLVALIAALVLVRLCPLPLRWAARPAARLRGAVGFLSLARAGRSSAIGALPLLALLVALTTAGFGGSVLAGVDDARARAALLATGADARISGDGDAVALPEGAERAVREVSGVRTVTAVQIEHALRLPARDDALTAPPAASLVGVEPKAYAALSHGLDLGPFPADTLRATGGASPVLRAVASPGVAEWLGRGPHRINSLAGEFTVEVAAVRERTPAVASADFLIVDGSRLAHRAPTALLATGDAVDGRALRAAVRDLDEDLTVRLRAEARASFTDSPLQSGAERIYAAAIGAGAGYAVLALLLSLLQSAPERTTLLARLRTMGLTTRQGRQLLGLEALPPALLAASGGVLVGLATIRLLAPGVDLVRLALAAAPGVAPVDGATLRADAWSLALPAAGVVLLTAAVAGTQAWWTGRRGSVNELRAGDMR
ncbi:putative ABC transport system permease protein [Streptomyces sp. V4I23]|uniref:ABC transporter permease n=1 Tax=Streptomyces sp. V4I23 TaxID=3042282 RepID=UPI0027834C96|nr:ABC transporter permease [Streptomyces sp. V4I23]MDQ1010715.1 putative ABC transport system permease protein [Streptomyces sp. V4I23]